MARLISLLFHDVFAADAAESGFHGAVADRYKLDAGEFARAIDAIATSCPRVVTVASDADARTSTGVALTVDDGGVSYATHVADALEKHGWRGHCFMSTDRIGGRGFLTAAQLRDLDRRGHVIGSHSASHPTRFSACTWEAALIEWTTSRAVLEDVLGHRVSVASLPGGYLSRRTARAAHQAGLDVLFTSEPVTGHWQSGGCTLVGRFTVRPGQRPSDLAAIVTGATWPKARQWAAWRTKQLVKPVMGSLYPRVGDWLARHAR